MSTYFPYGSVVLEKSKELNEALSYIGAGLNLVKIEVE